MVRNFYIYWAILFGSLWVGVNGLMDGDVLNTVYAFFVGVVASYEFAKGE